MCNFFQWADQPPKGKVRDHLKPGSHTHPSREAEGYPLQGDDEVGTPFQPATMIRDALLQEPAIPFDPDLWDGCQNQPFFMKDGTNVIGFPRELQGRTFDPAREKELRQDLYVLHVLAKTNREPRCGGY